MGRKPYRLREVVEGTWEAACKSCGRPFRSDVQAKAIQKVLDHVRDCPKRKG